MKKITLVLLVHFLMSCSSNPELIIPQLNGYWEIDQVRVHDSTTRDYNFNNTIDYIEISTDHLSGFRRKLKPNIMGTFETSKSKEDFSITLENDSLKIYYKTPFAEWTETVLSVNNKALVILNNVNKDVYIYKRYESIDVNNL